MGGAQCYDVRDRPHPVGREREGSPENKEERMASQIYLVCMRKTSSAMKRRATLAEVFRLSSGSGACVEFERLLLQANGMDAKRWERRVSLLKSTRVGVLAYLVTMPPNECPTIITDVTELAPFPSPYKARMASTARFKNSAWQRDRRNEQ